MIPYILVGVACFAFGYVSCLAMILWAVDA